MIDVNCPCGRSFAMADAMAGKRCRCPVCLTMCVVPRPVVAEASPVEVAVEAPSVAPMTARRTTWVRDRVVATARVAWRHPKVSGAAGALALLGIAFGLLSRSAPGEGPPPVPVADHSLTTEELVARTESSVAVIEGKVGSGSGFLVRPGLIATNSHVIRGEFIDGLKVHFPSARAEHRGPFAAELITEDPDRDLAFLRVAAPPPLPPLTVIDDYKFRRGQELTVIGSPGFGRDTRLENAISRGIMSTNAVVDGRDFHQLSIAINPGNSGGPVFDDRGAVIAVITLKAAQQEGLGFGIPAADLRAAIAKAEAETDSTKQRSRHRTVAAFLRLRRAGAMTASGLAACVNAIEENAQDRRRADPREVAQTAASEILKKLGEFEHVVLGNFHDQLRAVAADPGVDAGVRKDLAELWANRLAMTDALERVGDSPATFGNQVVGLAREYKYLVDQLATALGLDNDAD